MSFSMQRLSWKRRGCSVVIVPVWRPFLTVTMADNRAARLDEDGELHVGESLDEKLALADRFGRELARVLRLAKGEDPSLLDGRPLPEGASARRELDEPVGSCAGSCLSRRGDDERHAGREFVVVGLRP